MPPINYTPPTTNNKRNLLRNGWRQTLTVLGVQSRAEQRWIAFVLLLAAGIVIALFLTRLALELC